MRALGKPELRKLIDRSRNGGSELATSLETIRGEIISLKVELDQVERSPASRDEAVYRLQEWLASVAAAPQIDLLISRFVSPAYREPPADIPAEIIAAAGLASLESFLTAAIDRRYAGVSGLSFDDRRLARSDMETRLLELELTEEAIIRSAESLGMDVLRRSDADPRAVLCNGEVLR
ncbi:hypothetical protein ACFYE9_09640 [Rhizobium leguminosarum]|uniref:Uncharacterized protein n=2 Tax=Rhizobium leguminosarum TaxID=384 RepID=A0A154IHA9_RHILE|nr:hypothetical protein [Rhizobium leguminosarum]KZA99968.1 hypothetical protein A4A59_19525 [Rhizobium leguminosarum]